MTSDDNSPTVRAHILVSGRVQGVGYRAFAARAAGIRPVVGGVRNLDDGRVELDVEGPKSMVEALVEELKIGPPASRVTEVSVRWMSATAAWHDFQIWYGPVR